MGLLDRIKDTFGGKVTLSLRLRAVAAPGEQLDGAATLTTGATAFTLNGIKLWLACEDGKHLETVIPGTVGVAISPNTHWSVGLGVTIPADFQGTCRVRAVADVPGLPDPQAEGSFSIQPMMPSLSVEDFEAIVASPPETIDFLTADTEEQRQARIAALPTDLVPVVHQILVEHLSYQPDAHRALPLSTLLTTTSHDELNLPFSSDYRIRVYRGDGFALVDFNGWPGDNERGAAFAVWPDGRRVLVFANQEDLTAADAALREAVEEFGNRRNEDLSPPADEGG